MQTNDKTTAAAASVLRTIFEGKEPLDEGVKLKYVVVDTTDKDWPVVGEADSIKGVKDIIMSSEAPPISAKDKSKLKVYEIKKKHRGWLGHGEAEKIGATELNKTKLAEDLDEGLSNIVIAKLNSVLKSLDNIGDILDPSGVVAKSIKKTYNIDPTSDFKEMAKHFNQLANMWDDFTVSITSKDAGI